ncbi:MAG: threonine synthase [Myxococcota bacterium]
MNQNAHFQALEGEERYPLTEPIYQAKENGSLLEVAFSPDYLSSRSAAQWRERFQSRNLHSPGPYGSGVWRYHEWVLPDLPESDIVSLGEGGAPLVRMDRLSEELGVDLLIKQCGHSHTGSFKDLGMTVLVSQVNHIRKNGGDINAVACASTGDTSAALAAYGAAAGVRVLVLLPKGKITAAQLVQPLACGARVIAIDTDFDGCMAHVQQLVEEDGVYLANSKNSLRIEGQKTVAFEIVENLGWSAPDWAVVPSGNLGNISALEKGFRMMHEQGLSDSQPRLICAQAESANPLFRAYERGFDALEPLTASPTMASAIRIGNPVSYPRAVAALQRGNGIVTSSSEQALSDAARLADHTGTYLCPHTAVAVASVIEQRGKGVIGKGEQVAVISTAHGLKFTEFKVATVEDRVPGVSLGGANAPIDVPNDWAAVRDAALRSE